MSKWLSKTMRIVSSFNISPAKIIFNEEEPAEIKKFRQLVSQLNNGSTPIECFDFFVKNLLSCSIKELVSYDIKKEVSKLIRKLIPTISIQDPGFHDVLNFLSVANKIYVPHKKNDNLLCWLILQICDSNNEDLIDSSIVFLHSCVEVSAFIINLFSGESLGLLWEHVYVLNPIASNKFGPIILSAASCYRFSTKESTKYLQERALFHISNTNMQSIFVSAITFIAAIIMPFDATDFLYELFPLLFQKVQELPSLRFFSLFFDGYSFDASLSWRALSEICMSEKISNEQLESALIALNQSEKSIPKESFSFKPYAIRYSQFDLFYRQEIINAVSKSDINTKSSFCCEFFKTNRFEYTNSFCSLITNNEWGHLNDEILSSFFLSTDFVTLKNQFESDNFSFSIASSLCDQICERSLYGCEVMKILFEIGRMDCEMIVPLVAKVCSRLNPKQYAKTIILELFHGVPLFLFEALTIVSRNVYDFNSVFLNEGGIECIPILLGSVQGMNFFSALVCDGPIDEVDKYVEKHWEDHFSKISQNSLYKLMKGLSQDSDSKGLVRIPSIAAHLSEISDLNASDKHILGFYCSQRGINNHFESYIDRFIGNNQFHTVINNIEVFNTSLETLYPMTDFIQFHPDSRNSIVTASYQESFSFWFFIDEYNAKTIIFSNSAGNIEIIDQNIYLFNIVILPIQYKVWNLITITTVVRPIIQNSIFVYLNGKKVMEKVNKQPQNMFFGSESCNNSIWFLYSIVSIHNNDINENEANMIFKNGLVYSQSVKLTLGTGAKLCPYEGIIKFIKSMKCEHATFIQAKNTQTITQLQTCLELLFKLFSTNLLEKKMFCYCLRYISIDDPRFSQDIIAKRVVDYLISINDPNFDILNCFLCDFHVLTSRNGYSFIYYIPIDIFCETKIFPLFCYLLDTMVFFNLDNDQMVLYISRVEITLKSKPSYIKKLFQSIISVPNVQSDDQTTFGLEEYYIQDSLIRLLSDNIMIFQQSIEPIMFYSFISSLTGKAFFKSLMMLKDLIKRYPEFYIESEIKLLKGILRYYSNTEDVWSFCFFLITNETTSVLEDYLLFIPNRIEQIHNSLSILPDLIQKELSLGVYDGLSFRVSNILLSFIVSNGISLLNVSHQLYQLFSLGYYDSSLSIDSDSSTIRTKGRRQSWHSFHFEDDPQCLERVSDLVLTMFPEIEQYKADFYSKPSLIQFNQEKSQLISDFNIQIVEFVCSLLSKIIIESKDNIELFKQLLVNCTIGPQNIVLSVSKYMHKNVLKCFLLSSPNLSDESLSVIYEFSIWSIVNGWWDNEIRILFDMISVYFRPNVKYQSMFILYVFDNLITISEKIDLLGQIMNFDRNLLSVSNDLIIMFLYYLSKDIKVTKEDINSAILIIKPYLNEPEFDFNTFLEDFGNYLCNNNVASSFVAFSDRIIDEYSNYIQIERNRFIRKPKEIKTNNYVTQWASRIVFMRRLFRKEFFMRFNLSNLANNESLSNMFNSFKVIPQSKRGNVMLGISPNPLVAPFKLLPCVLEYEASYSKENPRINYPVIKQNARYKSKIPELNENIYSYVCYKNWFIPHFVENSTGDIFFRQYSNVAPYSCSLLFTPETTSCIAFIYANSLRILIDCELKDKKIILLPISNILSYSTIYEGIANGYFGKSTLFCNHHMLIIPFNDIGLVIPRKYAHQDCAFDIYTIPGFSYSLIMNPNQRKHILSKIKGKTMQFYNRGCLFCSKLQNIGVENVSKLWSTGKLSTFEYILYCNMISGRSFNDLSQYPVFPWVIGDYSSVSNTNIARDLSKPMGALNNNRAEKFMSMYQETNPHYFFGTHYSYPASVLYFMMRIEPFTMYNVVFHTGFDHKDRLFSSISETWKSASETNQTDLKELIPQFFFVPSMLRNINNIPLEIRTDGTNITNVLLPQWAPTPEKFVWIMREFLESTCVSNSINEWIDLIYGYKQRGNAAIESMNLFHPLTYGIDENKSADSHTKRAQYDAITNFGQCPTQIMNVPHPKRTEIYKPKDISTIRVINPWIYPGCRFIRVIDGDIFFSPTLSHYIGSTPTFLLIHEGYYEFKNSLFPNDCFFKVTCSSTSKDGLFISIGTSIGNISVFYFSEIESQPLVYVSSLIIKNSSFIATAISSHYTICVSSTSNYIYLFDISTGTLINEQQTDDSIKMIDIHESFGLIIAASESCIYIFNLELTLLIKQKSLAISSLYCEDIIYCSSNPVFLTGSNTGTITKWEIINQEILNNQIIHSLNSPVTSLCMFNDNSSIIAFEESGNGYLLFIPTPGKKVFKQTAFSMCPLCHQTKEKLQLCPMCGIFVCKSCFSKESCCVSCNCVK